MRNRYEQWRSSHDRDLFSRIALAFRRRGTFFYTLRLDRNWNQPVGQPTGRICGKLCVSHLAGWDGPPNVTQETNLIQMPIFAEAGRKQAGWFLK